MRLLQTLWSEAREATSCAGLVHVCVDFVNAFTVKATQQHGAHHNSGILRHICKMNQNQEIRLPLCRYSPHILTTLESAVAPRIVITKYNYIQQDHIATESLHLWIESMLRCMTLYDNTKTEND